MLGAMPAAMVPGMANGLYVVVVGEGVCRPFLRGRSIKAAEERRIYTYEWLSIRTKRGGGDGRPPATWGGDPLLSKRTRHQRAGVGRRGEAAPQIRRPFCFRNWVMLASLTALFARSPQRAPDQTPHRLANDGNDGFAEDTAHARHPDRSARRHSEPCDRAGGTRSVARWTAALAHSVFYLLALLCAGLTST